jgi:hypothetical protein
MLLLQSLCFTQDAVYFGATHWADSLCHTATRIRDFYVSFKGTLLFALNAVGLTLIFLSHYDPPIAALESSGTSRSLMRMRTPYP